MQTYTFFILFEDKCEITSGKSYIEWKSVQMLNKRTEGSLSFGYASRHVYGYNGDTSKKAHIGYKINY